MNARNPKVDDFLSEAKRWRKELEKLRAIILGCHLTEELKWSVPCYTFGKTNLVLIGELKDCCTLSFLKGALLSDPKGILAKPGENTQAARVVKFTSVREISGVEEVLKDYIREAIEVENAGLKVEFKDVTDFTRVEELEKKLAGDAALKAAFEALTPGRQRAYNLFFSAAKQSVTRDARIEKYRKRIMDGKGINDCTCGLSKKMPGCDGSHKYLCDKSGLAGA